MAETRVITVEVKGISPLLMHRYPLVPVIAIEKKTSEEQAEIAAYRVPETKELFIPGNAVQRMLANAGLFSKGKGRASLKKIIAASVLVFPERALLGVNKYEIDIRPVVNPTTKGRVLRHRPRLNEWAIRFDIHYDPDLLTEIQLRKIVDDGGSLVGLLDYRPDKMGPFGRFMVTSWNGTNGQEAPKAKEVKEAKKA